MNGCLRGERHGHGDQAGVEDEIGGRRGDERARDAGDVVRERAGHAAERVVGQARRLHRDGEAGHAEQRPVDRVLGLHPERALAPRARDGDEHRLVRTEQQQRREVDGVRHRHRRAALGERQAHLERGRDGGHDEEDGEEQSDQRRSNAGRATPRAGRRLRSWRQHTGVLAAAGSACARCLLMSPTPPWIA